MSTDKLDLATGLLRVAAKLVGGDSPKRLGWGIFGGFTIAGIVDYLGKANPDSPSFSALADIGLLYFIAAGVFLAFTPQMFGRRSVPEEHKKVFDVIDEARVRGGITKGQAGWAYHAVVQKTLDTFDPAGQRQIALDQITTEAIEEAKAGE